MKSIELKNRSREELVHMLAELKAKVLKLNFDKADNKIKDTSQFKKIKKDVARVMTEIKILNK